MIVKQSNISYPLSYKKDAVIRRFNALYVSHKNQELDWAELIAELIEAYVEAKEEPTSATFIGDSA